MSNYIKRTLTFVTIFLLFFGLYPGNNITNFIYANSENYEDSDETIFDDFIAGLENEYDLQPTTMQEVEYAINDYLLSGIKPRWQYEVSTELMPLNYYCAASEENTDDYYTIFEYTLTEGTPVPIYNQANFIEFLKGNETSMQLMTDIVITANLGPTALLPAETDLDIDRDLTIYGKNNEGQRCTLTFNASAANQNYLRLTGSHTLQIFDLNIVSAKESPFHIFTIYDLNNNSTAVWNAEFYNITFNGGGLIGTRNDMTNFNRGKIGNIKFISDSNNPTSVTIDKESTGVIGSTGAEIQSDVGTITFQGPAEIYAYKGTTAGNGVIYSSSDIIFEDELNVYIEGQGASNGLIWSENGDVIFDSNVNINASGDVNKRIGLICAPSGTVRFNGNANVSISEISLLYSPVVSPIIFAKNAEFLGLQTSIHINTPCPASNHGLIHAENIVLGALYSTSYFIMTGTIDSTYFNTPSSSGNFIVNPNTNVEIYRARKYRDSDLYLSNRNLISGYTDFIFGEDCVFTAKAGTNNAGDYNLDGRTALIRSDSVNRCTLERGAKVTLESISENNGNDGISGLILKKPDNGELKFDVKNGGELSVTVYGKVTGALHGGAPIAILGNSGQPNSKSTVTIQGFVSTYGKLGNGWYYQFSTGSPSGKDIFDVDGGHVILNADCAANDRREFPDEYAAFEHYSNNNFDLIVRNGGFMHVISNGWRTMSLAGGSLLYNDSGIKTIEVIGSESRLKLEGAQFGIAAEVQAKLYIRVLDGGTFESYNTQDSNIYTTGLAEYTVSGYGSKFILEKSGKVSDTENIRSLYGAIFHDASSIGALKINVIDGGYMRVVSDYGSRAAICAQTSSFVHEINVTGTDSTLEVINRSTTSNDGIMTMIADDALYPLGAVAFAANTSGNIYVGEGGNFYAESHHPLTPTIALGGYAIANSSGTLTLNSPGSVDIRNDSDNNGDIRAIALRGKTNYAQDVLTYNTPGSGRWRHEFTPPSSSDMSPTFKINNTKVTVYKINGSSGTQSFQDWNSDTIIRSWSYLNINPPAYNVGTMLNLASGTNGFASGYDASDDESSFSLYRYGRIAAGAAIAGETYSVTYYGNGGATESGQISFDGGSYRAGTTHHVIDNIDIGFEYPGLHFLNWNTQPDGLGISYSHGDTIVVNGDVQLYAVWSGQYLEKKASTTEAAIGEEFEYIITVGNDAMSSLTWTNVIVTDVLPMSLDFVGSSYDFVSYNDETRTVTIDFGNIEPSNEKIAIFKAKLNESALLETKTVNIACVVDPLGNLIEATDNGVTMLIDFHFYKTRAGDVTKKLSGAGFILYYFDDGTGWEPLTDEKKSDDSGLVIFERLKAGTYMLMETFAPYGYRISSVSWRVIVGDNASKITVEPIEYDELFLLQQIDETYYIGNEALKYSLPMTGGNGNQFIGTGTVMICTGLFLVCILYSRRHSKSKQ